MLEPLLSTAPECVLFDLDGTLLDTEPLYTQAANAVVGRFGHVYDWTLKRHTMGGGARSGAQFVIAQLGLPLSVDEYLGERDAILRRLFTDAPPMPGAVALVEALHARGVKLAIATSSERELCELKLARHPFARCFDAIVCADDPGIAAAKPAPDLYLAAAGALGCPPERCLVIEDTPNGVASGRAAGMHVIAVVDPHIRDRDYRAALAVLDSLEQLSLAVLGF